MSDWARTYRTDSKTFVKYESLTHQNWVYKHHEPPITSPRQQNTLWYCRWLNPVAAWKVNSELICNPSAAVEAHRSISSTKTCKTTWYCHLMGSLHVRAGRDCCSASLSHQTHRPGPAVVAGGLHFRPSSESLLLGCFLQRNWTDPLLLPERGSLPSEIQRAPFPLLLHRGRWC